MQNNTLQEVHHPKIRLPVKKNQRLDSRADFGILLRFGRAQMRRKCAATSFDRLPADVIYSSNVFPLSEHYSHLFCVAPDKNSIRINPGAQYRDTHFRGACDIQTISRSKVNTLLPWNPEILQQSPDRTTPHRCSKTPCTYSYAGVLYAISIQYLFRFEYVQFLRPEIYSSMKMHNFWDSMFDIQICANIRSTGNHVELVGTSSKSML